MKQSARAGRRQFLQAAIGVAATGSVVAAARPRPSDRWDSEFDIVCVGAGGAGLTAAATASSLGDRVAVLEKGPVPGGTTLRSGSAVWVPNNEFIRKTGATDSEHDCLRYMCRYAFPERFVPDHPTLGVPEFEFGLLKAYYANASPMAEYLGKIGAHKFSPFEIPGSSILAPDYAPQLPESLLNRGRTLESQPQGTAVRGAAMIAQLTRYAEVHKIPVMTEYRVSELVLHEGRVVGVIADTGRGVRRIGARKAVIFTSGGYAHNLTLIALHQRLLAGSCATPLATGDFMSIAGRAGAMMGDLSTAWRMQVVLEEALTNRFLSQGVYIPPGDSMILVNSAGVRVVDERRNYNDRTRVHFDYDPLHVGYPNQYLFMLFDQRTMDAFGGAYPLPEPDSKPRYLITGQTLDELSARLSSRLEELAPRAVQVRLAADFAIQLGATIERFNGFARSGVDEDFFRGRDPHEAEWRSFFSPLRPGAESLANTMPNVTMHPISGAGPYYAIILAAGALDTCGGPLIDENAQVLSGIGHPIPGLYGAGNCIASPTRGAYFGGGGTLGPALTFAYIAAKSAHQQLSPSI